MGLKEQKMAPETLPPNSKHKAAKRKMEKLSVFIFSVNKRVLRSVQVHCVTEYNFSCENVLTCD